MNIICLSLKIQGNTLQERQFIMRTCAYLKSFAICFNLGVIYLSFYFPALPGTQILICWNMHVPPKPIIQLILSKSAVSISTTYWYSPDLEITFVYLLGFFMPHTARYRQKKHLLLSVTRWPYASEGHKVRCVSVLKENKKKNMIPNRPKFIKYSLFSSVTINNLVPCYS